MDQMTILFSTSALIVSLISLLITIWLWRESHRPIVTARIRTHKGGNLAILYVLELVNSGSRPARNVRLHANHTDILNALLPEASSQPDYVLELRSVKRCFEQRATVSVLLNGESITNAFGFTSIESPFWRPGAIIPVVISYEGVGGALYRSVVALKIDDTAGFAGTFYDD